MTNQQSNINKILTWDVESFFNTTHLQQFQDFSDENPKHVVTRSKLFTIILKKLKEASSDPIQLLREPFSKESHFSKDLHQHLCVTVICNLDNQQLRQAYAVIPHRIKTQVMKAFWKKRKQDCCAWKIDQNELPEELRKKRLQKFGDYVKTLVERKDMANIKKAISVLPDEFESIEWPWGYSALMYSARFGGVEVATLLLELQKEPETEHRGKSFTEFLEENCPRFIPVYDEW